MHKVFVYGTLKTGNEVRGLEALLFDIRFLVSGLSVVVLYDIMRRKWQTAYREV